MGVFSFALRQGGFLLLGSSESVGRAEDLFSIVSKKHRLFRRTAQSAVPTLSPSFPGPPARPDSAPPPHAPVAPMRDLAHRAILEAVSPPCVLIDAGFQVRYFHGDTDLVLKQPAGEPTRNLLEMLRPGIKTRLRALVREVRSRTDPQTVSGPASDVVTARGPEGSRLSLCLKVSTVTGQPEELFLVAFLTQAAPMPAAPEDGDSAWMVRHLEQELTSTREDLQSTIEELETSNEELKASNEEVMSMKEEFQSTNEELETSKEELQSLNEELTTVNAQLQDKVGELETANNDLANLFDATDIAVVFIDRDGIISRFTPQAGVLLNLRQSDLGRPAAELRLSVLDETLHERIMRVGRTLQPSTAIIEAGDERWFSERINPYRTADDHIDGVVLSLVDITDEIRGHRETERQRGLLATVMDQATEGIVITDAQGHMTLVNAAARRMARGDPAGAPVTDGPVYWGTGYHLDGTVIAPEDWVSARVMRTRAPVVESARMVRDDGSSYDIAISAAPVFNEAGEVIASVAIFRDITDEHRLIIEREEAREMAEHANAAKTRFLANLSHDLRTPLNAILGFSDALLEQIYGPMEPRQAEILGTIRGAGLQLRNLVEDILDMARVEAGQLRIAPAWVSVADALANARAANEPKAAGRGTHINANLDPPDLHVWADPVRLNQVLTNLLDNAIKYGHEGGTVTVNARRLDSSGAVRIAVTDDGPGMTDEALAEAFEPFNRGDAGDSAQEGVGLGLTLVRTIVTLHGGTATLARADAGGLTVTIDFPAPPPDAPAG